MRRIFFVFIQCMLIVILCSCSFLVKDTNNSVNTDTNCVELNDVIRFATWNIGHFSNGDYPHSNLKNESYKSIAKQYKDFLDSLKSDFIFCCEYSYYFTSDNSVDSLFLFDNYPNYYIGKQKNYSCNAIFSKYKFFNLNENEYENINPTDYYYISFDIIIDNINIKVIVTHCAFDFNNSFLELKQYEELVRICDGFEHVIMLGDFNAIHGRDEFKIFSNNGYVLANHGELGDFNTFSKKIDGIDNVLDNIIVKGLVIKNVYMIDTSLSDHNPLICEIKI